jgi:hypothetical protein
LKSKANGTLVGHLIAGWLPISFAVSMDCDWTVISFKTAAMTSDTDKCVTVTPIDTSNLPVLVAIVAGFSVLLLLIVAVDITRTQGRCCGSIPEDHVELHNNTTNVNKSKVQYHRDQPAVSQSSLKYCTVSHHVEIKIHVSQHSLPKLHVA